MNFENIILILTIVLMAIDILQTKLLDKKSNCGYFEITETNIPHIEEIKDIYRDRFIFTKAIKFRTKKYDTFLINTKIEINWKCITSPNIPYETLFTADERFNIFSVNEITKEEKLFKNQNKINICLTLYLKNEKGYTYKQIITMDFEKDNSTEDWWKLYKYNTIFKK